MNTMHKTYFANKAVFIGNHFLSSSITHSA